MRNAAGNPQGTMKYKPLHIGAGGYITAGIQFANDGTAVCGGDSFGAWVKGPTATKWTCLYESGRLPAADIAANNYPTYVDEGEGCYAITIAPTDSSRIYMSYNGFLEKSTDGGATFTRIGGPYVMKGFSYQGARWSQRRIVCDPRNANVMMLGPQEGKIIYTTNGGTTMNVLTVAAGTPDGVGAAAQHFVAVDPSNAVAPSGGISQKWAYSVQGTGVYESTTGPGGTYSLLSGSPATPRCLVYDQAGNLWALKAGESAGGNIYKKTPAGSFAKITPPSATEFTTIAVDPNNTNHIMLGTENGEYGVSLDGGATWLGSDIWNAAWPPPIGISFFQTAIRWMGQNRGNKTATAEIAFRPTDSKVFMTTGIGVFKTDLPSSFAELKWYEDSLGIEEMEVQHIVVPSGGYPLVSCRDRGIFPLVDESGPKNVNRFANPAIGFGHSWFIDDVPGSPGTLIGAGGYNNNANGKSTDYGLTWTAFSTIHPAGNVYGGSLVASSASVYFWFPANNARPAKTTNGGATWAYETIGNTPTSGETGWGYSLWNPHQIVACDKTTGDVYAWNYGDSSNGAAAAWAGLWKWTASAGTWAKVFSGTPTGASYGSGLGKLKAVPGQTGHLYFKGDSGNAARSTNGGVTWTALSGFTQVSEFAFGKAAPGKTYPTIFVLGTRSGVFGLYRSDDDRATWVFCGSNPMNQIGGINFMCGHPDVYGKIYIGYAHHAGVIGEYNSLATVT